MWRRRRTHAPRRRDSMQWLIRAACRARASASSPASADASFRRYFRATLDDGAQLHRDGRAARAGGLPAVRARRAACLREAGLNAPRSTRRIWRRASCCSPTSARTYLHALNGPQTRDGAVRRRDRRADALAAREPAARRAAAVRRGAAAARTGPVSRTGTSARHLGMRLTPAAQSEALETRVRADRRQQPRAADGLRAPRLHAAQPDGVRARTPACSTSRTRCSARSPTTSRRSSRRLHQLGRGARARLDRALLGKGEARRGCRCDADFAEF